MTNKIFISHSSRDQVVAEKLTELLRASLRLSASEILCTSVAGHKLPGGADTEAILREKVRDAELVIGIITSSSVESAYVLFELGARWGFDRPLIPFLATGDTSLLREPLRSKNALRGSVQDEVHQLVDDVGELLKVQPEKTPAFSKYVTALVEACQISAQSIAELKKNEPKPQSDYNTMEYYARVYDADQRRAVRTAFGHLLATMSETCGSFRLDAREDDFQSLCTALIRYGLMKSKEMPPLVELYKQSQLAELSPGFSISKEAAMQHCQRAILFSNGLEAKAKALGLAEFPPNSKVSPNVTDSEIKPGDIVQMKSGGYEMTVEEIDDVGHEGNTQAQCKWFDNKGNLMSDLFGLSLLRKIR